MSRGIELSEIYNAFVQSPKYSSLTDEQREEYRQRYNKALVRASDLDIAESQAQTSTKPPAGTEPVQPYQSAASTEASDQSQPQSRIIAKKFDNLRRSTVWSDKLSEEQRQLATENAKTLHRQALAEEGVNPDLNARQVEQQEIMKHYMPPETDKKMSDGSLGTVGSALNKSLKRVPVSLASTVAGGGGMVLDAVGKAAGALWPAAGDAISGVGTGLVNASNIADAWNQYAFPPEQAMPETIKDFKNMSPGQVVTMLADQGPEQAASFILPMFGGARAVKIASNALQGANAAGKLGKVLKPVSWLLKGKTPQAAQRMGAFGASALQSYADIGKEQLQETGEITQKTAIPAALAMGKLESLVPASAEWVAGLKSGTRKAFTEAMKSPVKFLTHVGAEATKNSTIEGVTEFVQEGIQKIALELSKQYPGEDFSKAAAEAKEAMSRRGYAGLIEAAEGSETVGRLAMATLLGGVTGFAFEGTGRTLGGARYMTSPVRHYDAMVSAKTDEEKKVAAEAWGKLKPEQRTEAAREASFRSMFELDDPESDDATVKEAFDIIRDLKPEGYAALSRSLAANGWVPTEKHQERLDQFLADNPDFAKELEKISGAQAVKTAPKVTQEKPYVNLQPESNISSQKAPAKPQPIPGLENLINQIAEQPTGDKQQRARAVLKLLRKISDNPLAPEIPAIQQYLAQVDPEVMSLVQERYKTELRSGRPTEIMNPRGQRPISPAGYEELANLPGLKGKQTEITNPRGAEVEGEFRIVEADEGRNSFAEGYDQRLQDRIIHGSDDAVTASRQNIERILGGLKPGKLITDYMSADAGPSVFGIGSDGQLEVEIGNHRDQAIREGYANGDFEAYRTYLIENAEKFGYNKADVEAFKAPKLIRVRTTKLSPEERIKFANGGNLWEGGAKDATSVAQTDAKAIGPVLDTLIVPEDGNINIPSNREFFQKFLDKTAAPQEHAALLHKDALSQAGMSKVKNAIFAYAYENQGLIDRFAASDEEDIKKVLNGMLIASGDSAKLKSQIQSGSLFDVQIGSTLAKAADKLAELRAQKTPVEQYLKQGQFFRDGMTPEAKILLVVADEAKSAKSVSEIITAFNDAVRKAGHPAQLTMDGPAQAPNKAELLRSVVEKHLPGALEKAERIIANAPSLEELENTTYSRKGQRQFQQQPATAGDQKLLDLLNRIGQNADPETAQASNKLVNLINSIGDKTPEQTVENKPADETGQGQVKYFSQPKDPGVQAGVISREELENTARTIQANLEPTTGVKVVVLETTDELTEIIQKTNPTAKPVPSDVEGALFNNTAYLVRNNLPDAKRATEVAGHEIIGHFGLQAILGREFTSQLVELEKLAETDQQVKAELDRAKKDYFDEDESAAKNRRIALEEALARISEKYAADPDTFGGKVRAWFEQSIGKIRDALRVLGFDMKFDARDLANTIRSSKAAVTRDGSFNKKPRLSTMAEVAAVDEKYRRVGPEAEQAWNYAKKNAHKILFSYGRAEDFPFFKYLSPETQTAIRKDLEAHARGNKARIEEARKNARTETPIRSLLEFEHSTVEWAPFMFMGKSASIDAFGAAKSIVKNDPDIKAFRAQIDIKNQKFLNDFMGGDEDDADKVFLKKFAELFKEAIDGVSNNNVLIKKGGDDWDAMVVTGKDITEDDFRYHLENAHRKAILHAIEQKVAKDVANARAEEPNILGESLALNYELAPDDPRLIKLTKNYASKLWKYLTARGIGFRIGVVDATNLDFDQTNKILVDQHHREKTGEALDAKSAAALRRDFQKSVSLIQRGIAPIRSRLEGKILASADGGTEEQALKRSRAKSQWGISPVDLEHEEVLPNRLEEQPQPSKLERLISQIGEELPPQHKETGNKLLDILSSLGGDENAAAEPASYQIEKDLTGDPRFSRAGKVQEKDPTKQLTLDFFTADQSKTEDSAESVETKSEPPAPVLEKFFQEVEKIRLGSFKHNVSKITGPADVAAILAPIADKGRETFMTVVVNAKKKPIAVIRVSTGGRDQTVAIPIDSLGAVASIPDAAGFYIAHNHPSGTMQFSNADRAVARRFSVPMSSTGVAYLGSLILGNGQYKFSDANLSEQDAEKIPEYSGKKTTPILGDPEIRLRSDQKPLSMAKNVYDYLQTSDVFKNNESGIILVNGQNQILAEMAMPTSEMKKLRTGSTSSGAARILAAMDKANASGLLAVMKNSGKSNLEIMQEVTDVYSNLTAFASDFDVRMLDVMAYDPNNVGWTSARENGLREGPSPYFSRKTDPEKQPAKTQLEKLLEALPEKDISKKAKSKLEEILDALPDESPKYSYAGAKAKRPKGVGSWKNAKAMLDAGEDAEAVRLKTGWFVNQYDQKPRFEIDDSQAKWIKKPKQFKDGKANYGELGEILKHDTLFEAYPQLKAALVKIEINPDFEINGSAQGPTANTPAWITIEAPDADSAKDVLVHEYQHLIQRIEGFARGGNSEMFERESEDEARKRGARSYADIARKIFEEESPEFQAAARKVNREVNLNAGADKQSEAYYAARKDFSEKFGKKAEEYLMNSDFADQVWRGEANFDARGRYISPMSPFDKYRSLAGEIEARDAADRTELSAKERELYPPYSTAEYGPDEAIVRYSISDSAAKKAFDSTKKKFGVTDSLQEAGYVLPDGSLLDFSGRNQTGDYKLVGGKYVLRQPGRDWMKGQRSVDHREIEWDEHPDGGADAMVEFMRKGAIRIDAAAGTISLHGRNSLTPAQKAVLRRIVEESDGGWLDLEDDNGQRASVEYDSGDWKKVLRTLNAWEGGQTPKSGPLFSKKSGTEFLKDMKFEAQHERAARLQPAADIPSLHSFILKKGLSPRQVSKDKTLINELRAEYNDLYGEQRNNPPATVTDALTGRQIQNFPLPPAHPWDDPNADSMSDEESRKAMDDYFEELERHYRSLEKWADNTPDVLRFAQESGELIYVVSRDTYGKSPWRVTTFYKDKDTGEIRPSGHMSYGSKIEAVKEASAHGNNVFRPDIVFSRKSSNQTETQEFKKWFGNSKIVDDQGRPMVVYHGTNKKFNVFAVEKDGLPNDAAMFFSGSKKVAEDFAGMRSDTTKGKPRVVEAYLNINNPAQIGNIDDLVTIDQLWKRAGLDVRTIPEGLADLQGGAKMPVWQWYAEEPAVWRAIEDAGFDGAVGTERGEPLYVAFSPTQAKSATDNRGTFDPENPDIRFSKQGEADPGFRTYSEMERTLTKPGMLPKKASKADMVSAIQKHVGKFKKVELEESGLIEHLQSMQDDQVTSQDVADYLDMNRIELEEVQKSEKSFSGTRQEFDNLTEEERNDYANTKDKTRYPTWQVPGGEKYRELLLVLPSEKAQNKEISWRQNGRGLWAWHDNDRQISGAFPSENDAEDARQSIHRDPKDVFGSSHWSEDNVLLHVRFNERDGLDGERVLFIEEVQSDWHQQGRKRGYKGDLKPMTPEEKAQVNNRLLQIERETSAAYDSKDPQKLRELETEKRELEQKLMSNKNPTAVPNAPFKQTDRWAMLGMKRMIQWAADNGFDKVAWAPGDEQAKRYDLSKQISEIIFEDNQSGGIGLARLDGPATNGQLIAFDKNKRLVINQHIQPEQLEDYIGKDAAKKLLEQQPQRTRSAGIGVRQRKLGGVDLKVGGEGMKAFYDGILKNETAKYIKKWGAKVGAVEIPIKDDGFVSGNDVMDEMNVPDGERQSYWANLASDEREELISKYRNRRATAHGFDITPAMRQGVAAGQPLYSKKGGDLADQLDPNPEPAPTLTEESKSQATKVFGAIHQVASGLMGKTVSQRDRENPAFKRSQTLNPEADTDFELERKNKIDAATKARAFEDKTILDHLDADKNLITGMIRKLTPKGDLQDWLLKKAARVLAPYQAAKPIERILFTVGENIAWDGKKIVASPGIRSYNPETGEYEYKPSEHAAAAMHFFNMLSPEWQELMTERAKANEEYRQNFVNVVIPHRKAQTAIALLARYRQMNADRTALEGAEAEARSMLKALDGKIDQAEHNELKSLLEEVVSIPADRINKMVVRMESIIKQATGELKTPAQLQRALKSLNTNRGHYGYVHHFFESDRVPSQGKAFDAFGRVPNGWIEDVPGTQKIRTGAEGNKRNLLEADIAKEAKEAKAEAANNWMRDIEDQRGLLVEEFEDIPDDQMPEGYVGYENERPFRRRVFANFGKYRGQEIYLPVKTFDSYKLVKEKGVDDPSMKEFGETIAMLDGVANRMNEAMLYHTGKFARDLLSAPFHIIEFVRDWSFTSPTEIPFVIKALTKAIASQASAKTWQKSTPESHGEYSESLPYQNKSDKKSFLTRAGDAIGRLITKDLPVGSTVAAMLKEINLSGAADLPLKRIFESVGEQLAERRGLKGKARERFVYDMINQYAFVTQDLPPWLAWLRGQMPSKESRGAGAIMRLTIPFLGYSSRLAKQMLADPVSKGLLPMAKRLIGKKDADANFLREFSEASRPFFWLFFKSLVASGLGGLLPPEEEGIASDIQGAENLNPLARTHGRILWSQDDDPKGGENWLSVKGLGHLQVADALSDVVAGKSSVSDLSTEFLTIHPAMSWILGSVGVENPYDAKVPKGARAGRMLAQALVPQLTRYGPEMGKFFRAAAGNNTIPDAQKQSFFTAFFEQLGIPAGEVKVDRDGKLRTTRTALELLKQVGVNMRHIPYDMIAEAVDSELGSAKYYTDRLEMIQEYRDGDRDTDLSEREFIAQTLQTNKWTKIDDAERDMTKALVDRGQGALATLAKLRQKGVPVNAKPPKKKKDKGFGGSFGGKKFGGGFGSSFKKSPESKREEKVSDLEKKIQEIQSNQPKPKSWHDQLLDAIKSI